jgi:hypothetical protein
VTEQLKSVMFDGDPEAQQKADKIVKILSDADEHKAHERHIPAAKCIEMGLRVRMLEDDNELQDLVLTVHHCYMHAIMNTARVQDHRKPQRRRVCPQSDTARHSIMRPGRAAQRLSAASWRFLDVAPLKEEVGRYVKQLRELLSLRLADRSLAAYNFRGYAAGTKHVEQVALPQAMLLHKAAQPAVGRRSFKGIVGVLKGFNKHCQEFGVFPLFRRQFVIASV